MPGAPFAAEILDASAAVDEIMAEAWVLQPRMRADERTAPDVADASRAAATFNAIFLIVEAKPVEPYSYDMRSSKRPGVESGKPHLEISPYEIARLSQILGVRFVVQPPDLALRLATGVTYRLDSQFNTDGGHIRFKLNLLG